MFAWNKQLVLQLLIPFTVGLSVAPVLHYSIPTTITLFILIIVFTGIASYLHKKTAKDRQFKRPFGTAVFFVFMFLGISLMHLRRHQSELEFGRNFKYELYKQNRLQSPLFLSFQDKLHTIYSENGINGTSGAIIEAMTIGRKTEIGKPLKESFSKAGISHLLAISGFHIMIVFLILQYAFLGKIAPIRWRLVTNMITILCLWLYALMTGMQPSISRAVLMCTIMLLSNTLQRSTDMLNSCSIAAFIILIIDPLMLYHIGFQLSVASVVGIHFIAKPHISSTTNPIISSFLITLACSLFSFPLVAYHFHSIPTLGILTSLIGTIITIPIIYLSALWWLCVLLLPAVLPPLTTILLLLSDSLVWIAEHVSTLPFSTFHYSPSISEIIIYYYLLYLIVKKTKI